MFWDLLKRTIYWGEDGVICGCPVENFDNVIVLIDQSSELGGVLAFGDQFIDGHIWLVRSVVAIIAVFSKIFHTCSCRLDP